MRLPSLWDSLERWLVFTVQWLGTTALTFPSPSPRAWLGGKISLGQDVVESFSVP